MTSIAVKSVLKLGEIITSRQIEALGRGLGSLFWLTLKSRRELAIENIHKRLDVPKEKAVVIAKESFSSNCQSFLEILLNPTAKKELKERLIIDNAHYLAEAIAAERPVVGITAHLGAWELLTGCLSTYAPEDREQLVVMRKQKNKTLQNIICSLRGANNIRIVEHRNAARPILKALKNNAIACFLADHNCSRSEAIFLPFLGKLAAVNRGPALLATRANALVLTVFLTRQPDGRLVFHCHKPIDTAKLEGTTEERIRLVAEYYTKNIEEFVRKYPEQWFWMHKRWKTRPEHE